MANKQDQTIISDTSARDISQMSDAEIAEFLDGVDR
jgi:hypothetical protein